MSTVSTLPCYEVHAVKYAELKDRRPTDIFIGADPHDAGVDMDYFVWAITGPRTIIVDTGFNAETAKRRGRTLLRCPGDGLRMIGIDPVTVADVIVTHLHYDHFGNPGLFPAARLHIQDREMSFATGRMMRHRLLNHSYESSDVQAAVGCVFDGRVIFHDGDDQIAPGVTVHLARGHTAGLQFVRVHTHRGWVILASDACHYTQHRNSRDAFPVVLDVGGLLETYERLEALASDPSLIIPGHDPRVLRDFPPSFAGLEGVAAQIA